ncbi:MAG: Ni/Fe hydrogenase subunit alpha [Candidatus Thermoplasmatota archaeon]|nr:Ni/Fe hydrogenase subunit alpha [Candidatus Thermoplasmatota archaeon]
MPETIINIDYVARVEGQGALNLIIAHDGKVKNVEFRIFEPPRFFESFLIGRKYDEVMELASRICGICPVAHQITALRAIENALKINPSQQTKDLRKLTAISAHIQSNVLSMYFLSLPDLMGYESIIPMAKQHPDIIKRGLKLKKLGNDITDLIGGRAVHPVTMIVDGFSSLPSKNKLQDIRKRLLDAKQEALDTVDLFANLEIPDFHRKCEHVAISDPHNYAINKGQFRSTESLDCDEMHYRDVILERQKPYSTALHSFMKHRDSFMVGPLPRLNINFNQLSTDAKTAAKNSGIRFPNYNPFISHLARAIELVHDIDESIELIDRIPLKEEKKNIVCNAGFGAAITEAPRGSLYHSYELDNNGIVRGVDIVPPTAHNVNNIEKDMIEFVQTMHDSPVDEITLKCEMLIRAYDPCISCSAL